MKNIYYDYWKQKQVEYLKQFYGFSTEIANIVFERNWEKHHHSLYELEECLESEADYAELIVTQMKKECY